MTIPSTPPTYNFSPSTPQAPDYTRLTLREISSLYANMSDYELAKILGQNFVRFEDPEDPGFVTEEFLGLIAMGMGGNKFSQEDQVLALQILKHDGFTAALGRHENGENNGKFDREDLRRYMEARVVGH